MTTTNIEWAISKLAESYGIMALKNIKAIDTLESYIPFENDKACLFIIKTMITEEIMSEVLSGNAHIYSEMLCKCYGFNKEIVVEILDAISKGKDIVCKRIDCQRELNSGMNHIKFKGLSVDGALPNFKKELEQIGFEYVCDVQYGAVFKGEFAGCNNCEIIVLSSRNSNIVWKVIILFPKHMGWYSLKNEYTHYKKIFTNKYGEPDSYEYFTAPYEEGDGNELTALFAEKCSYCSYYKTSEGSIVVRIDKDDRVMIGYEDAFNADLAESEKATNEYLDI